MKDPRFCQQVVFDPETEPGHDLSFNTTVAEWRAMSDLRPWKPVAAALAAQYRISQPIEAWASVLEPASIRTLAGVTGFISRFGTFPRVSPAGATGAKSIVAGVFAGIQAELGRQGVPLRNVRPSSPIAHYIRLHGWTLITFAATCAPGALPLIRRAPRRRWFLSRNWEFGDLRTFRDYAECIAAAMDAEGSASPTGSS
jgi:hypothetical protein